MVKSGGNVRKGGGGTLRVAVVAPQPDKYSETFIRNHVERLPGDVEFLYGGFVPTASATGHPPTYRSVRVVSRALATVTGRSVQGIGRFLVNRAPGCSDVEGVGRYLRDQEFDVVLAEYGPTGVSMVPSCRQAGVPMVVHFHGYDAFRDDVMERWGNRYPEMFEYASAAVAVSRSMADQLVRLGSPTEKVRVVPYGIDLDRFSPGEASGGSNQVLSVGRFVDKKAPHLTVLAFRRLLKTVPSAELHLVGEGPLQGACRTLVRALDIEDRVSFHGVLPHRAVAERMERARCYVQHSVIAADGDREGTPLSVLEAAASGLPVVATRHEGIVDVIEDGISGRLVEEGDIEGMADALADVLGDPDRARRLGRSARRVVRERYDRSDAIGRLHEILRAAARGDRDSAGDLYPPDEVEGESPESVST